MRPVVKICGLMRVEDVQMCVRHGTDIVGFVVEYPRPVPWNLNLAQAKELIAAARKPAQTCVVTSAPNDALRDHVFRIVEETKPDYVQLHGDETLENTAHLVSELGKRKIKIIKALFPNTPDLEKTAAEFCKAGVYAILYDPRSPDSAHRGGAADLSVYQKLRAAVDCPVILAGGITPENAAAIVRQTEAQIIDLMTGVESDFGVKDEVTVVALFRALDEMK
ncbi:MAG: phosphoribosylanthranilate isomerase [Burkholderiales bacterium]|jgi:phosphoribosylanthranilate isomerase|nr:phosphoribosylanthranilate isomerase [Burkholderiales bacterium]